MATVHEVQGSRLKNDEGFLQNATRLFNVILDSGETSDDLFGLSGIPQYGSAYPETGSSLLVVSRDVVEQLAYNHFVVQVEYSNNADFGTLNPNFVERRETTRTALVNFAIPIFHRRLRFWEATPIPEWHPATYNYEGRYITLDIELRSATFSRPLVASLKNYVNFLYTIDGLLYRLDDVTATYDYQLGGQRVHTVNFSFISPTEVPALELTPQQEEGLMVPPIPLPPFHAYQYDYDANGVPQYYTIPNYRASDVLPANSIPLQPIQ